MARKGDNSADIAKMLMKVDDVADTAKAVDKTADAAKAADVAAGAAKSDSLNLFENAKDWVKKSATDATKAVGIAKLMGNSRNAAFFSGFATRFVSEIGGSLGKRAGATIGKTVAGEAGKEIGEKAGGRVATVVGNVIGSALTNIAVEIAEGNRNAEDIVRKSAEGAAVGFLTGMGSEYIDYAIEMANTGGTVAGELMKYDKEFGSLLKIFFDRMFMALEEGLSG